MKATMWILGATSNIIYATLFEDICAKLCVDSTWRNCVKTKNNTYVYVLCKNKFVKKCIVITDAIQGATRSNMNCLFLFTRYKY